MDYWATKMCSKYLKEDEELLSSERFKANNPILLRLLTGELISLMNQSYFIGITNIRILVIPISRIHNKPLDNRIISLKFKQVKLGKSYYSETYLLITPSGREDPKKYYFYFGLGATSGNKREFLNTLLSMQEKEE